jgi:hypothetical protein
MRGSVYKRCTCPAAVDSKGRRKACKLSHGSWYYVADLPPAPDGLRRQDKRGGFATKAAAEQALAAVLDEASRGLAAHDGGHHLGDYLDGWLETKERAGLRGNTLVVYRHHVEHFLKPHLGALRLRDLRPTHVEQLLRVIAEPRPGHRQLGPATVRRVHATLRSALSSATRRRLITHNPAKDIELPKARRPRVRPWEAAELGAFLDHLGADPLAPVFETIAATGLRRGEALGLRWDDVDLERRVLVVRQQLLQVADATTLRPCPYSAQPRTVWCRSASPRRPAVKAGQWSSTGAPSECCSHTGCSRTRSGGPGARPTSITAWSSHGPTASPSARRPSASASGT